MSNMAHCRFENTLADLRECYEHIDDKLDDDENKARQRLIRLCKRIADDYYEEQA